MTFDSRWQLPKGKTPEHVWDWAFSLIRELRKGDYLSNVVISGLSASDIDFAATQRVLGRNTSGAGAGEEVTLSQLLDWIGSANRGDIIRRGASAWESLNVGTSGQVLTSDGTDPAWATPSSGGGITTIASGSLSGTAVPITDIPETYAYLVLQITGGSSNTASRTPLVRVSVDNGSSYDATAGNYPGDYWNTTAYASTTLASLMEAATLPAVATFTVTITIFNYHTGPHKLIEWRYTDDAGGAGSIKRGRTWYTGSTSNIDALQLLWSGTGSFDAGTYALYGVA